MKENMNGFLKLRGNPDLFTEYKEEKDGDWKPVEKSKVRPFLHPLTGDELHEVEAVAVEAYRLFAEKGASDRDATWKSARVEKCQLVYLTLKRNKEKESPRLFEDEAEVVTLHFGEVDRIFDLYWKTFRPTKDEIKNCLRERLGDGSKTESTSPRD